MPTLSSLWLKNPINVGGSAIAIIGGGGAGSGNCLLALGNTATGNNASDAIQIKGGGGAININVPGCGVYSNSSDCSKGAFAVDFGGNAKIVAGSLGANGCIDVFGNASVTLPNGGNYTQKDGIVADPYAGTTIPSHTGLPSLTKSTPPNTSTTLNPGYYPGGISLAGGSVTLNPGVYILGGAFDTGPGHGGTTVTGNGVTLAFSSSSGGMNIDSLSNVTLIAPTTGPTAGFVLMGDSTMPFGTTFQTAANATVSMTGTIYLPKGDLTWSGNPNTGSTQCLRAIVNTISLKGDSAFSNANCNSLFGGGGGSGPPIGSVVTLVN